MDIWQKDIIYKLESLKRWKRALVNLKRDINTLSNIARPAGDDNMAMVLEATGVRSSKQEYHMEDVAIQLELKKDAARATLFEIRKIEKNLDLLGADHKNILVLSYVMEMTDNEIASEIEQNVRTIKTKKYEALRQLAQIYWGVKV